MGLLKTGLVLEEPGLVLRALAALDFVLARMFDPSRGVYAYWNGTWNQPGDLRQQAAVLRSLVDAVHTASANRYLDPARAIAAWTDEHLSASDGSFRGDLHQRELPAVERSTEDLKANALMAEGLLRLAVLTGEDRWHARARTALEAFLGAERSHGYEGAAYGRALDLLVHAPSTSRSPDRRTTPSERTSPAPRGDPTSRAASPSRSTPPASPDWRRG